MLIAFGSLFLLSCTKQEEDWGVSVRTSNVTSDEGQQFVKVVCEGDWTLGILYEGELKDWATLSVESGSGNRTNIVLKYLQNTTESTRRLRLILDNGRQWKTCSFAQDGAGRVPEGDDSDINLAKTGWLELPATDNPDLAYFSHRFKLGNKSYRNYSFGWSQDNYVSLWVAYPLCSMYTNKSVERTNAWAYDPLLGSGYSSAPFGGYGGNYARGHQLPSADRLCCAEANKQTFYGTNIVPQLDGHNEGIWQTLENQIRTWANGSDTTYVVTGCVIKGATSFENDSDGHSMPVPKAFFKALIRYSPNSTYGTWNAAAFYTEHRSYSNDTEIEDLFVSIDQLEQLIGLDLFVNLPKKVGASQAAALEASTRIWW